MRRKSNQTKAAVVALAAVIVLAVISLLVWQKVFVVRNVVIEGGSEISREDVIRASKVEFGGRIGSVDAEALKVNLENTGLYALDGVKIKYPNTVILTVRQRTRDAVIVNGGYYLTLDSDGYVIEAAHSMPEEGGIYVYGLNALGYHIGGRISADEKALESMKAVLDAARAQNARQYISDLNVSDERRLTLTTRTGICVELGDAQNMDDKMRWMCSAVSDLEGRGHVRGTLDVSGGNKADYQP